jgi:pimeloyl-ACP methyl ester carboxylesterase
MARTQTPAPALRTRALIDLSSLLIWLGRLPLRWRLIRPPAGLAFREVGFPARDGTHLAGWYFPHSDPRGAVVLCHGIYSTRMAVLDKARLFNRWGFASLAFDFRGRGRSQGKCTIGFQEPMDVLGALDFLRKELPGIPLAGLGESLGASSLLAAMSAEGGLQCACLEACFATLQEAVSRRAGRLSHGIIRNFEQTYGQPISSVEPLRLVRQISQPLLFIHDQLDWSLSVNVARRLASAAPNARLWVAPWSLHTRASLMAAPEYYDRVGSFFCDHMRRDRRGLHR